MSESRKLKEILDEIDKTLMDIDDAYDEYLKMQKRHKRLTEEMWARIRRITE